MKPYLRFSLNGMHYAVEARSVREIFWLPELTLADEAPSHIAGVINLRGRIASVVNLGRRLGHPAQRYQAGDCVIMLDADDMAVGVIVNGVSEVVGISDAAIEPPPRYEGSAAYTHFLAGNAKVGDDIVMLLDVSSLIQAAALPEPADLGKPAGQDYFCPEATAEEREVFHRRAHALMQTPESTEMVERIPLSIIQLGSERFGVGLDVVREFSPLRRVTPVPCCPPHIAGNMNLRGDILTLTDIRPLLNVPLGGAAEVMVIESGGLRIGVPVDRVLEVIYPRPADILPVPAAMRSELNRYCTGVVRHDEGMVGILDMAEIIASGGLEVEEQA